jgi:hypothetical protein
MKVRLITTIILVLVLDGCTTVSNEADLVGDYLWPTPIAKLELTVNHDHSYQERIEWTNGKVEQVDGVWTLRDERVVFEGMIIPHGALSTFPNAPPSTPSASPRIRSAAFSPERHYFGRVMLIADPDNDVGFRRR